MNRFSFKSLLIFSTVSMFLTGAAVAQHDGINRGKHHGPRDAETRVAHMTRILDLSDEQSAELLEVLQAADVERDALHQKALQQMEPEICALQLGVETEMERILDDDQLSALETRKNQHEQRGDGKGWRNMHHRDCSAYE
jgi:hypothetical protein